MVGRMIRDAVENMVEDARHSIEEQKREATRTRHTYQSSTARPSPRLYTPPDANSALLPPPPPPSTPRPPVASNEPVEAELTPGQRLVAEADAMVEDFAVAAGMPEIEGTAEVDHRAHHEGGARESAGGEEGIEPVTELEIEPMSPEINEPGQGLSGTQSISDLEEEVETARDLLQETKKDLRLARRDERRARRRQRDSHRRRNR